VRIGAGREHAPWFRERFPLASQRFLASGRIRCEDHHWHLLRPHNAAYEKQICVFERVS
jgi:hypothetical protein